MILELLPLDPLFFRDGKPFTMGDDANAGSIFPPPPSAVYGGLRSAYIAHNGGLERFIAGEMREIVGTPDEPGSFALKGVFLKRGKDLLVPAPLDLAREKEPEDLGMKDFLRRMRLVPSSVQPSVLPCRRRTDFMLMPEGGKVVQESAGYFISHTSLEEYLAGDGPDYQGYPMKSIVEQEPKLGIKRDAETHASQEGFLYRVNMYRLGSRNPDGSVSKVSLVADCKGSTGFPGEFLLRLGGDGKSCLVRNLGETHSLQSEDGREKLLARIENDRMFKVYLATPAIFHNGWLPKGAERGSNGETVLRLGELELKLICAAIGKPLHIGGWDMHRNKPKPMRRAVPAGSVYFFKIIKGEASDAFELFDNTNISDFNPEQGFGLSFVGAAK